MTTPMSPTPGETSAEAGQGTTDPQLDAALEATEKRILEWAKSEYQKCKIERVHVEQQWQMNLAFYFGKQNVINRNTPTIINGSGGKLWTPPAPYYRARPIINRIRPTIREEMAKLVSQKPSAFVIPATSDDRDIYAAQAGENIWESTYRKHKLANVIRRAIFWSTVCGTSFIKSYWDPDSVDEDSDQMGDFCYQAETPFHLYVPNLRETELENQPYIIHAQLKSRDFAKMYYPNASLSTKNEGEVIQSSFYNLMSGPKSMEENQVLVLEVWIKPGAVALFPKGAFFTIVGNTLVQSMTGWPYDHKKYPFAKIDSIPGGKFYSDSSIVDLIPLQREYNRTNGQIIEAKNRMAKPQLIAERGAVDAAKITSEPGQIILYTPGFQPPQPLPMQPLPQYVENTLKRILEDWSDISGSHEVSQGQAPPGVTAATAISYLQEQDQTKLSLSVTSLEEAVEKLAYMTLNYVKQYWDTKRTVRVVGDSGAFDVMAFKGSDLRGNTDIKIEAGSAMPQSRAAKQAFIMDLMKMQFIDPKEGLKILEMGGVDKIYEKLQVDERQAMRENLKMGAVNAQILQAHIQQQMQAAQMNGMPMGEDGVPTDPDTGQPIPPDLIVPVNTWDNHAVHIETHNNYRKGQEYDNLSQESKNVFDQHVQQHLDMINAMSVGLQGQPGSTPGPASTMTGPPPAPVDMTPPEAGGETDNPSTSSAIPTGGPGGSGNGGAGGQ